MHIEVGETVTVLRAYVRVRALLYVRNCVYGIAWSDNAVLWCATRACGVQRSDEGRARFRDDEVVAPDHRRRDGGQPGVPSHGRWFHSSILHCHCLPLIATP